MVLKISICFIYDLIQRSCIKFCQALTHHLDSLFSNMNPLYNAICGLVLYTTCYIGYLGVSPIYLLLTYILKNWVHNNLDFSVPQNWSSNYRYPFPILSAFLSIFQTSFSDERYYSDLLDITGSGDNFSLISEHGIDFVSANRVHGDSTSHLARGSRLTLVHSNLSRLINENEPDKRCEKGIAEGKCRQNNVGYQ